jgi:hypothetical protein
MSLFFKKTLFKVDLKGVLPQIIGKFRLIKGAKWRFFGLFLIYRLIIKKGQALDQTSTCFKLVDLFPH